MQFNWQALREPEFWKAIAFWVVFIALPWLVIVAVPSIVAWGCLRG